VTRISLKRGWPLLLLFIGGVIGIGFVVGLIADPAPSLRELRVPDLVPPVWIIGPLWFLLATAFAVAGWRLWMLDSSALEMRLWLGIQILSWWYAPVFFLIRSPALALGIIAIMAVLMVWFMLRAWTRDRISSYLFIPCFLWVAYVVAMNAAIVVMN
jgi:benzodiazapine receptor